jgi:predicted HicB family RNase H-like nuclease
MKDMNYKGYFARVEFDPDDHIFVGHIMGIRDVVGFHGESVVELDAAFREAVNDYLAACKKLNQEPD